ncbi:MAG: HAD family phosphatase [Synergistaceae bacterium]|nr:HAD family phosphatase [Synergistaceae bacterium]MBR0203070.1 HAD family phosphatase [Synergistaceae bacterium]
MSKIKNVIFDIGNVLVDFDWGSYTHSIFMDEMLIQELDTAIWGDGRWDRLDWGEDSEIAIQRMIDYAPEYESEIKLLFSRVGEVLSKREYSHDWIKSLKSRGYGVYYLSNYSKLVMDANPDVLDFLPLMDGGVFSCNVHLIKPDHKIYRYIANQYNLVPSECVFIDDLLQNVQAAEDCGFHAIQFLTYQQARLDLEELLEEEDE